MKKRQSFLLLEVLVAFTLIALFGIYWIRPSYAIQKAQKEELELQQLRRYGKEQLLQIKMALLSKKILLSNNEAISGELPARTYRCYYQLTCTKENILPSKRRGHLYSLKLIFYKKEQERARFSYPLYIEEVLL